MNSNNIKSLESFEKIAEELEDVLEREGDLPTSLLLHQFFFY